MLISHRKKFVMLSPWKTASQSAKLRLKSYNENPYPSFFHFNPHLNRVVHQHITYADFSCLPESKLGYFVASFVRNPYDRVFSGFRQLQVDLQRQPLSTGYPEPWVRSLVMKQLSENFAQLCQAQFDFDRWLELVADEQIYEIGRNTNFPLHPAHYWTHSLGKQAVNFVGRVENFDADFATFLQHVNIDDVPAVNANVVDLEGSAANNPFGYRYLDRMNAQSIAKINRLFERDFEFFGYERITG